MKIYVASSWRNPHQQRVVEICRAEGHEVYDFRNPVPGENGFSWREIDPEWEKWTTKQFLNALQHRIAKAGFDLDMTALRTCEMCILVLPCGRSAHLEMGFAVGNGKATIIYHPPGIQEEPELMYKMCRASVISEDALRWAIADYNFWLHDVKNPHGHRPQLSLDLDGVRMLQSREKS